METKEVIKSLEKLAEKLGKTAEEIFGYYVRNAKMYRVYFIIEFVSSVFALIAGIIITLSFAPDNGEWLVKNVFWVCVGGLLSLIGLVCICSAFGSIRRFINSWANPEYEALEDLFGSLFSE